MSSSRSIAAARNRRAGETVPKQPLQRPITSISSQAAFSQNVYKEMNNNQNIINTQNMSSIINQSMNSNKLPFTKLTVSDAVGLITLRLGKVEQYIMDVQHNNPSVSGIPENAKIVDNSVLTSLISRIDSLEKKEIYKHDEQIKLSRMNENTKLVDNNVLSSVISRLDSLEKKETHKNDEHIKFLTNEVTNLKLLLESLTAKINDMNVSTYVDDKETTTESKDETVVTVTDADKPSNNEVENDVEQEDVANDEPSDETATEETNDDILVAHKAGQKKNNQQKKKK
jgi:hypothetical protein